MAKATIPLSTRVSPEVYQALDDMRLKTKKSKTALVEQALRKLLKLPTK